jgi:ABC-type transport system involved in Fe-S cluster assembly fused permease/ATPase subunit
MFSEEVRSILIKVISSWQVIVVAIAIAIYFLIVNKVSKYRARVRRPSGPKTVKSKKEAAPVVKEEEQVDDSELGLEDDGE